MADGCDISEHQGVWSGDQFAAYDFVIIRAVNENGYPDRTFAQNWQNAAGRTLRGVYGWPIPGGSNLALGAQLVAGAPDAEAGYWADVERSGRGLAGPADVRDYLIGIGDHVRGFYSNIPECPRSPFLDGEMWWAPDYGPNDGNRHDPDEQAPRPQRAYTIHQYSSNPLDKNYSPNLDWTGTAPAPGPPALKEPPVDYLLANTDSGSHTLCTALGETADVDGGYALALIGGGMPVVKADGMGCTNLLTIRAAHRIAFLAAIPGGGNGGGGPLTVMLTGTAEPAITPKETTSDG